MIAEPQAVVQSWKSFLKDSGIKKPQTEAEYLELRELGDFLALNMPDSEPGFLGLFKLVTDYMMEWEQANEEPIEEASGGDVLRSLMEEHGVSQMQLEREGIADQGLLSKILSGKRQISKRLAVRLGERFKISPAVFL